MFTACCMKFFSSPTNTTKISTPQISQWLQYWSAADCTSCFWWLMWKVIWIDLWLKFWECVYSGLIILTDCTWGQRLLLLSLEIESALITKINTDLRRKNTSPIFGSGCIWYSVSTQIQIAKAKAFSQYSGLKDVWRSTYSKRHLNFKPPDYGIVSMFPLACLLGQAWASPTLVGLHCKTRVRVCLVQPYIYRKFKSNEQIWNLYTC